MRALPRKQQGVALITAVLIVALVTAAAVSMASKQQFDIRRTANIFNNDIAYQFALGAEDYARNVLEWDADPKKGNPGVDHLGEDWAQEVAVPVEGAMLTGSVQDLQGRINLNALIKADRITPNAVVEERFQNLLKLLGLNKDIAEALQDWIDEDFSTRFPGGAEDDYYMLQTPPYRAANRIMASVSELLLLKGVDHEAYQLLLPHVTVLPDINSTINVNTASAEVLASLATSMTLVDGEDLIAARPDTGFDKISSFTAELKKLGNHPTYIEDFLDVKSSYFQVDAMAEFDESIAQLHSLVERKNSGVQVLTRSRGAY